MRPCPGTLDGFLLSDLQSGFLAYGPFGKYYPHIGPYIQMHQCVLFLVIVQASPSFLTQSSSMTD